MNTIIPTPPAFYQEPLDVGDVRFHSRFALAPLAGYTNYPYRRTIREIGGVGMCTTDLVNARAIIEQSGKTLDLLATGDDDKPLNVQIFGSRLNDMTGAARWLQDYGATLIDINMGCPVRKVVSHGGGSAMMCDTTGTTIRMIEAIVNAVSLPVTVKMRLGWDADNLSAPYFAREFEKVGVAAITIHGRTREQGFSGNIDRQGIRATVEAVGTIPVFGNGDVRTINDAAEMIEETGCHGIAIGRGALANPWIFEQLQSWIETGEPTPRASYFQRIDVMELHLHRLCEWKGSETYGCRHFRKVAAWYGKALRVPKQVKHQLTLLDSFAEFDAIASRLRSDGPPEGWSEYDIQQAEIAVPSGPIAHW